MDLELSDEQTWLAESVDTLLARRWVEPGSAWEAGADTRAKVWAELVEFGALDVGTDGLGAVELCLISRALGAHLASVPFLDGAALRWALEPFAETLPPAFAELSGARDTVSVALLEPGRGWAGEPATTATGGVLCGRKLGVEHIESAATFAVTATTDVEVVLVLRQAAGGGLIVQPEPSFDPTVPLGAVAFDGVSAPDSAVLAGGDATAVLGRLTTIGALLAAADAVGAAGHLFGDACRYAGERKQFGHTIGSNQALRHLLADLYVRQASSWSTVLYAAAALDDDAEDAARTVSVAKAYVARAAREVAHGAMQVFGGIAFTAEHPTHRFLRRIVVRERQFGDAMHHERALGHSLAQAARDAALAEAVA
jgi:alkylation response protein AidB-like acyl-CoA dehydrogenase